MAEKIPMGIGQLGFKNLNFKRKFRFSFELFDICGSQSVPMHYVKNASRPKLSIEEHEVNFLHAKTWLPGKGTWEPMSVTYLDVATEDVKPLFDWIASVYNFTDPINLEMGSIRSDYTGTAILKLWDGCGNIIEEWQMRHVWPTMIDFGELDYADPDICTIDLTLRYTDVDYINYCPGYSIDPCCSGCGAESEARPVEVGTIRPF